MWCVSLALEKQSCTIFSMQIIFTCFVSETEDIMRGIILYFILSTRKYCTRVCICGRHGYTLENHLEPTPGRSCGLCRGACAGAGFVKDLYLHGEPTLEQIFVEDWTLWKGPMLKKWRTPRKSWRIYAKLIFPSRICFVNYNDCHNGWTISLSLPQPTRWILHISSPSPAEEVDDTEFSLAPDSQKVLAHHNRTRLRIFGSGVGFFAWNSMSYQRYRFMECHI